ncbi:hypothetical protein MPF19_14290 [Polaribacter sp. Z014]|uniref:hypothetical protein n=1 Tax=Polaribacter sp. Z014 TaxID=2927126 RepID=UPI002021F52A|nr:hypothetical protein [Polaribacter sp. Z014]MCL7764589.1 hypothetical protein [Polaribacter sp. Z014]
MRKSLILLLFFYITVGFSQVKNDSLVFLEKETIHYNKSIEYAEKRVFTEDLKEKYNDKEFQYTEEDVEEEEEKKPTSPTSAAIIGAIIYFISHIFPFILGAIIIFIILKTILGADSNFWNFKKSKKKVAEKLIYEDEDIHETDIEGLLQKAILSKEYRLAIRYYYLSVLKILSNKKLIDYHKDKTNSEYLFEIEDTTTRTNFSYLSYVYSYVWYGDFPIDETNFKLAESKYQSFKKSLK